MKKKTSTPKYGAQPTQKELDQAIEAFQKKGGQVKRIEPLWIEDGHTPGFQPK